MKTIKLILFVFLLFIFGAFAMGFAHSTQVFNDIQLLFVGGMFLGSMATLVLWMFFSDKGSDDTDIIVKIKKDEV